MEINSRLAISEQHILIIGNRSYRNLGDELILLGTVKLLLQAGKEITIAAYDPEWLKEFFRQFIDVDKITFVTEIPKGIRTRVKYLCQGKLKDWKIYRKADAVIIGGGEIITEENKNSYRYRLASLLPCLSKPRYLMGGIQLPKKRFNRLLLNILLKKTNHIFARDQETVHELKKYGYEHVEFFMDTSYFAYDWKQIQKSEFGIQNGKKFVVVNINKNAEQFLPQIIEDVKKYYQEGYQVMYVPVAKGEGKNYDDKRYVRTIEIGAKIQDQGISILDWENDFKNFITTLAQADMVISSRLHLFLIASFLGIPTKVYPYQKKILKMQDTLEQLNKK